ncbi:hypothetical protein KQH82_04620 [bacterium]|nr:hypothetical protein [bacterium]
MRNTNSPLRLLRLSIVSVVVAATLMLSCSDDDRTTDPGPLVTGEESAFFPLAVGNRWLFVSEYLDDDGSVVRERTDSMYVAKQTEWLDQTWYEVVVTRSVDGPLAEPWRFWWSNGDNGLYDSYDWKADPPSLLFQFPADSGLTYNSGWEEQTVSVTVKASDVPIYTGNRRFSGWIYEFSTRVRWTLSPGVGPIQIETIDYPAPLYEEFVRTRLVLSTSSLAY